MGVHSRSVLEGGTLLIQINSHLTCHLKQSVAKTGTLAVKVNRPPAAQPNMFFFPAIKCEQYMVKMGNASAQSLQFALLHLLSDAWTVVVRASVSVEAVPILATPEAGVSDSRLS